MAAARVNEKSCGLFLCMNLIECSCVWDKIGVWMTLYVNVNVCPVAHTQYAGFAVAMLAFGFVFANSIPFFDDMLGSVVDRLCHSSEKAA